MKDLRVRLTQRFQQITARLALADGGDGAGPGDHADVAVRDSAQQLAAGERERLLVERQRVVRAIDRLDEGHYGICTSCAEPIAKKRLKALPWAEECWSCATRREALEARANVLSAWTEEEEDQ